MTNVQKLINIFKNLKQKDPEHNTIILDLLDKIKKDGDEHLLFKEQNPTIDIRFVFTNSKNKINKKSKTTYADWCDKYGFKYADKVIPEEWFSE